VHHGDTINATIPLKKADPFAFKIVDSAYNIWSLKERYDKLVLLKEDITPKIVEEARDLLKKGEVIIPDFLGLDNLRVIITLADGDRERAVALSHHLSHDIYFKMFYGLDVSLPEY